MSEPQIVLSFVSDCRTFQPGQTLAGSYRLEQCDGGDVEAIELSVLWYTEGKGEEDLAVHFFDRLEPSNDAVDVSQPREFRTQLPASPLSYAGIIVKILWCVRVRVFMKQYKSLMVEELFQLGSVPEPEGVET